MGWPFEILFAVAVLAFIIFLVIRNLKDEKQFEEQLKQDFPTLTDEHGDNENEEAMK